MTDLSGSYEVVKEIMHPAIPAVGQVFTVSLPSTKKNGWGESNFFLIGVHRVNPRTIEDWLRSGKIRRPAGLLERVIGAIT